MKSILNLIRWKNLVMIIIAQWLIKYALFEAFEITTALDVLDFSLLVLATVCIAAAGNIINDIYDVETDTVNKPNRVIIGNQVSERLAYNLFFALNSFGIVLSFYVSHHVGKSVLFSIFVIISLALFMYASYLKRTILIGNILISFLVAMSILIVGVFDLLPAITQQNRATQITFFKIIIDYAVFAFLINLTREIIKDIQDIDGDYKAGMNTLPISIGRTRANKIALAISILPTGAVIYFIVTYLYMQQIAIAYFLLFIVAPLVYCTIKIFSAEHPSHYQHISTIYKCTMVLGLLSLGLYPIILK